jgi:predicted nucleotidyltransferase
MTTMDEILKLAPERLAQFCRQHGVRKLSLFGSRLRRTHHIDSDVDLLVEFEASAAPTLLDLSAMESELSVMLGGLHVDLRTEQDLSPYFRADVVREAEVQFVAA